jgi:hypothetical protein
MGGALVILFYQRTCMIKARPKYPTDLYGNICIDAGSRVDNVLIHPGIFYRKHYNFQPSDKIRLIFSSTFRRKKVELLSSLRCQRLGRLSFRLGFFLVKFFVRVHFSKTIKGIHLKLGILVHYHKRNQSQQGRWPCDLYIQSYLLCIDIVHRN